MRFPVIQFLIALLCGLWAGSVLAHGDLEKPLYVAPDGVDAGRCQDAQAPCRTLSYALRWVGKGGQIRVAAGSYEIATAEEVFHLVNGAFDVRGGLARADGFRSASGQASILVGVPREYRAELAARGFHVIADRKGMDPNVADKAKQFLKLHESLESSMSFAPCVGGTVNGLACTDADLLSHVALSSVSARPSGAADVWGFMDLNTGREYIIIGYRTGTGVFDVTNAEDPREVGFIDGQSTTWRDIKVYQRWNAAAARFDAYAYVTTDGAGDGLFVIDMTNLPQQISRANYASDFTAAHNVYATNTDFATGLSLTGNTPTLVIAGSNNGGGAYRAYSLADPANPQFIAMPGSGNSDYMHDAASMIITDQRKDTQCVNGGSYCEVLFDFNEGSVDIWDVTIPTSPVRLSRTPYANTGYVHSGWWSEDAQTLFVHDELDEQNFGLRTTLRAFSLSDLTSPTQIGSWVGPTTAIDHNGFVRGNRYYMSNYSRGLTILDITDPRNPVQAGRLDTYPASDSSNFVGAWGAYPFLPSGNVAVSDINSGLYMVADRTLDVAAGSLGFSLPSYGGTEGGQLQISVARSGSTTGAVGVAYSVVPATGDGTDLTGGNGALNWADGDGSDKTITLNLIGDGNPENLERVLLRLHSPTGGATLANDNIASIYVGEAGAVAEVSFDRAVISTAERGFATAVAVVRRGGSASGAVSVDFSMSAGDADAGVDFQGATSGTINWGDGDADPKWVEFAIVDDGSGENDEFIELSLANAVGANIGAQNTLQIQIADGSGSNNAPNAVAGVSQTVASGSSVTLDGSQSNDPDGDALTYHWTQTLGPNVTLNNANSAVASFTAPTVSSDTMLRFQLTVSDGGGLNNASTTTITVQRSGGGGGLGKKSGGGGIGWVFLLALVGGGLAGDRRPQGGLPQPTRTDPA